VAGTTAKSSSSKWRLSALLAVFAMTAAACGSTPIDESAAVQSARAAAAAQNDAPIETTTAPETTTTIVVDAEDDSEVDTTPTTTVPETTTAETTTTLVDTLIGAAVSESGRAPAFGGGNPETSVRQALDVSLPSVNGPDIDVGQYLGQDIVLWFWAPWCAWCNAEAPRVNTLSNEFAGEVEIVGVAGVSDEPSMFDFVERHDLHDITHLADFDGHFWRSLDISYQPWWLFVNDNGEVILNWQGRLSEEEIRAVMDELIAA